MHAMSHQDSIAECTSGHVRSLKAYLVRCSWRAYEHEWHRYPSSHAIESPLFGKEPIP